MLGIDSQRAKRRKAEPGADRAFLEASDEIEFAASGRQEVYGWVTRTLCEQEYWRQGREGKGLLRVYIGKMTG